jgi:hypothetical protein
VKWKQVGYDRELGKEGREREREREIADWGERERTEVRRANGMGFKRGQRWLILTNGLNQHMGIFGYRK